jgi:hypothetical protein
MITMNELNVTIIIGVSERINRDNIDELIVMTFELHESFICILHMEFYTKYLPVSR